MAPLISEELITAPAGAINVGDLVFYTAGLAWRVSATNLVGKSIDVDFTVEHAEVDPASAGTIGSHRFRQSTAVMILRPTAPRMRPPSPTPLTAGDLRVGDVAHYPGISWTVNGLDWVGKSVDVDYVFDAHETEPKLVGQREIHRYRQSTILLVTRE